MSYMFFFKKTFMIFVSAMFLKLKIHSEANLVIGFLKKHVRVLARTCSQQKQKQSIWRSTSHVNVCLRIINADNTFLVKIRCRIDESLLITPVSQFVSIHIAIDQ